MGRQMRKVPRGWEHPKDGEHYTPLFDHYEKNREEFDNIAREKGMREAIDYFGQEPDPEDYMGIGWKEEDRVLYQMYENTTEGTPISPAFETKEELAHWLADTKASVFGDNTTDYEAWMHIIER